MPSTIEQVRREYGARGLGVVAIDIEEAREAVAAWVRESRVSVPVLLDLDGQVARQWDVTSTPTVFLLARDGRVVAKAVGNRPWMSAEGQALLQALLEL